MGIIRKRIACACGAAIASSSSIKYQLEELFQREGIRDVELLCCRFNELPDYVDRVCMIVTAAPLFKSYPVPVITSTCYLSGLDCEPTNQKILALLRQSPESGLV